MEAEQITLVEYKRDLRDLRKDATHKLKDIADDLRYGEITQEQFELKNFYINERYKKAHQELKAMYGIKDES